MVIYLPVSFARDLICNFLRKRSKKSGLIVKGVGLESPLKYIGGQKIIELEMQGALNKKDSDIQVSEFDEAKPLVSELGDTTRIIRHEKEITTKEIARYGFYIAPLWFITEVISSCTLFTSYYHMYV